MSLKIECDNCGKQFAKDDIREEIIKFNLEVKHTPFDLCQSEKIEVHLCRDCLEENGITLYSLRENPADN